MKYVAAIFALTALVSASTSAFADLPTALTTYKLAMSSSAAQKKIDDGIEKAVDDMMFITRPIARARLKSTNGAYKTIGFQKNGDKITIQYENFAKITKTDGKPSKWTREDGEVFTVTHKLKGNVLTQKFVAEDGVKTLTYVFSKDFSKMNVTVRLESPKLAAPMVYMLSYKK